MPITHLAYEGPDRVKAAFSTGKWARLALIKTQCDPTNLFCLNADIVPDP